MLPGLGLQFALVAGGYSTTRFSATLISFLRKTVSFYVVLLHVAIFGKVIIA